MDAQRTLGSPLVDLRATGRGRFASASFLFLWLTGWLVGEVVVLAILIRGAISLGDPGNETSWLMAGFLTLWLCMWTIGGIAAGNEFLRILFGRDTFYALGDRLIHRSHIGAFTTTTEIAAEDIERIDTSDGHLVAWTARGKISLSSFGTEQAREEAAERLGSRFSRNDKEEKGAGERSVITGDSVSYPPAVPDGWEEYRTPEGDRAVRASSNFRRGSGYVFVLLAASLAFLAYQRHEAPLSLPAELSVGGVLWLGAIVAAVIGLRRVYVLDEWVVMSGRLRRQRRRGESVTATFHADRLQLIRSTDSDGDAWYELHAIGRAAERPGKTTLLRTLRNPKPTRQFASWLVTHTGLPCDDQSAKDEENPELEEWLDQLEARGGSSRFLAKVVRKLAS